MIVAIPLIWIHMYLFDNNEFEEVTFTRIKYSLISWIVQIFFYPIIHYKPKNILFLIPLTISVWFITLANALTVEKEYKNDEYIMPTLTFSFLLIIIMPSRWRVNWCAFLIGIGYLWYQFLMKKDAVPMEFFISQLLNVFYFFLSSIVLSYKVKALYMTILTNEKLIQENNKLLELFPHGVIIQPKQNDHKDLTLL